MRNTIGTILDPHSAWMLLRSLETLELRMSRAGENAARVCAWLKDQPQVEKVVYLGFRSEEHTSELQSLMRISYAVFCLKKKRKQNDIKSLLNGTHQDR